MKATIDLREVRGIFSLKWTVDCQIELDELERAAVATNRLGPEVICYQGGGESRRSITLSEILARGMVTTFPTMSGAQKDRAFIENIVLPTIKSLVNAGKAVGAGPRVIEL